MSIVMDQLRASIVRYCAEIGEDRLLVQGAGGNVSWKDGSALWVKASGAWLSEAARRNIFVPVDFDQLQNAITVGDFSVTPTLAEKSDLKPSIETLLHALMPHKVVIHLHAIEALAHLVRENCQNDLKSLCTAKLPWAFVEYFKPGAPLAAAVSDTLMNRPGARVIFLKNHGMVIGGEDVSQIRETLNSLTRELSTPLAEHRLLTISRSPVSNYVPLVDNELHRLAFDAELFSRLEFDWALYPDHVVFLGPKAHAYQTWSPLIEVAQSNGQLPELVFVRDEGVFVTPGFSKAKLVQLRCYYDVLARQEHGSKLDPLSIDQVSELLNWDAEQYRMHFDRL